MPVTARRVGFSTSKAMPVGRIDLDGMAVAQAELELLAHQLGTIPDAGDLEALAVAGGDADDHVVDEGPRQAVELPRPLLVVGALHPQDAVLADEAQLGRDVTRQLALGTLDGHMAAVDGDVHAGRDRDGESCRYVTCATYQTYARISPPSWPLRACCPVMIPWLVLTMTRPRPPRTRGISVFAA